MKQNGTIPFRVLLSALLLALLLSLFACAGGKNTPAATTSSRHPVEPFGTVPEELRRVVEQNLFEGCDAFSRCVLTLSATGVLALPEESGVTTVTMRDLYGETLAEYKIKPDDGHCVQTLTATSDGGFLFVVGFYDYQISLGVNAGDDGFTSRVVKCDAVGNIVFDTTIDQVDGRALEYCLERDGRFYLFGSYRKPENRLNYGDTDVYVLILSGDGEVVRSACFGGSGYDTFCGVELTEDGFLLQVSTQSTDGDFPIGGGGRSIERLEVELDEALTVGSFHPSEREYVTYYERIGEKDGKTIYQRDPFFDGFDAGGRTAYLDYGDYYLVVSKHEIGEIETQSAVSVPWYCTETVYSGYDREGNLLFRAACASSVPDDESNYTCNRFRSLGFPPVTLPAGVLENDSGYYTASLLPEAAYRELLSDLKANGFALTEWESGALLFRDDCAVFFYHHDSSFNMYWYKTGDGAPENGISTSEAKNLLCPDPDRTPSGTHPIDVTPRGFFERTGGQIFAVPVWSADPNHPVCFCVCYFVRGELVRQFDFESIAVADLDGDGVEEIYLLSYGPTSGVFSFTLTVIEGKYVCDSVFCASWGDLSFVQASGKLILINQVSAPSGEYTFFYTIRPEERDGRIIPSLISNDPMCDSSGLETVSP